MLPRRSQYLTALTQDDFYLNLVDWSSTNILAVGLGTCVYLWAANTSKVVKLCDLVDDSITGIGWERKVRLPAQLYFLGLISSYFPV
jgi:WD40 repeat protein